VTPELFERAQATRVARRIYHGSPSGRPSYLLSGLLVCGLCGAKLTYHSGHDRRVYDCRAGQDQSRRCLGGQVTATIAERLIVDAWIELHALVTDRALVRRAAELHKRWPDATMEVRRDLLHEVIERVELVAPPSSQPSRPRSPPRATAAHPLGRRLGGSPPSATRARPR
jgi:hypothetical protein